MIINGTSVVLIKLNMPNINTYMNIMKKKMQWIKVEKWWDFLLHNQ